MSTQSTTNARALLRLRWRDHVRPWVFDHPALSTLATAGFAGLTWAILPTEITIGLAAILIVISVVCGVFLFRWIDRRVTKTDQALSDLERQIDHMKLRGIYMIYCIKEDASYIGSTEINFHIRWGQHITQLNRGEHHNARLQAAWDCYRPEDFLFRVVEPIDMVEDIRPREIEQLEWRALNMLAKHNYNVSASRVRSSAPLPQLQFVYPTKTIHAPALRVRPKRSSRGSK